jgi:putative DNA primase/helicase
MDPVGQFAAACLAPSTGHKEKARDVFNAYVAWSLANARRPMSETKFGRILKKKHPRNDDGAVHFYLDVQLHDVPLRPEQPGGPPGPTPPAFAAEDIVF